VNNIIVTKLD